MKRVVILIASVASTACVTTRLTPQAERVRVTSNPEVVRGCKFVGNVEGSDQLNGGMLGQGAAEENAMRRMKNKAAEMGANTIIMVAGDGVKFSGSRQRGEAYQCSATSP